MSRHRRRSARRDGHPEPGGGIEGAAASVEPAEPDDAISMNRRQVRGSVLLLLGRVFSLLFTVVTQVLIVRALSRTEYGGFAYALAIASAARMLLSLGQGKLLSRFLALYEEQRDYGRMYGSIVLAVGTIVATTIVLFLGMWLFVSRSGGPDLQDPQAGEVLLILLLLAPMEAIDQVFVSLFAVFSKPRAIFFRKYLFTPGLRLLVAVALVLLGADVVFLAVGYVATQVLGLVVYTSLLVTMLRERELLRHFSVRSTVLPWKAVFSFSIPTMTSELVYLSMHTGSVIILGMYQGAVGVAGYRAVFPAARLNQFVWSTFVTLYLPLSARLYERGDHRGLRDTYWNSALFLAVLTFPVFVLTTVFAEDTTVALFGERYADAGAVLALLAFGYYVNVALGFNAYTLQVYGRLRFLVVVNVVAAVANLVLCLALVPTQGAVGVALANCATMVLQNVANQLALMRSMGGGFVDRRYAAPYLLLAAAAGALLLVELLLDPGIVVAILLSGAVSVGVLLLVRRRLDLAQTFPEVRKVPLLRRLLR